MNMVQSPHKIKIEIACKDLVDLDFGMGTSDPFAILYVKGEKDQKWIKLGQTETINSQLSPTFEKIFEINYLFERNQIIRCEVFDEDEDGSSELIGNFDCPLNKLLVARNQSIKGELVLSQKSNNSKGRGKITLQASSVTDSNNQASMEIICHILDKKKKDKKGFLCFCKPPEDNPFLVIERQGNVEGNKIQWVEVYKSEVKEDTLAPEFIKISINLFRLCHGNKQLPLRFSLYSQSDPFGKPLLYGHQELTCQQILNSIAKYKDQGRELINEKAKPKVAGTITFTMFEIVALPNFVDYLKGGWYINMTVAIDFTSSNGTLHDIDPLMRKQNDYELALQEVGKILQPYSYKHQFTAKGFGGIPHFILEDENRDPEDEVNINCFNLKNDPNSTTIASLEDLRKYYVNAINGTTMWGPTLFNPLLDDMENYMIYMSGHQMYNCLLILTDGCIHDLRETVDRIVRCTAYPLSIIIVGIGDADFSAMETLDSDEYSLVDGLGQKAQRDIVQFVRLNEFKEVAEDGSIYTAADKLAEAVLAEVPDQLVGYMQSKDIKPTDQPKSMMPEEEPEQNQATEGNPLLG